MIALLNLDGDEHQLVLQEAASLHVLILLVGRRLGEAAVGDQLRLCHLNA